MRRVRVWDLWRFESIVAVKPRKRLRWSTNVPEKNWCPTQLSPKSRQKKGFSFKEEEKESDWGKVREVPVGENESRDGGCGGGGVDGYRRRWEGESSDYWKRRSLRWEGELDPFHILLLPPLCLLDEGRRQNRLKKKTVFWVLGLGFRSGERSWLYKRTQKLFQNVKPVMSPPTDRTYAVRFQIN